MARSDARWVEIFCAKSKSALQDRNLFAGAQLDRKKEDLTVI